MKENTYRLFVCIFLLGILVLDVLALRITGFPSFQ